MAKKLGKNLQAVASPGPLTIGETTYLVSQPSPSTLGSLVTAAVAWAKKQKRAPAGLAEALEGVPEHLQVVMAKEFAQTIAQPVEVEPEDAAKQYAMTAEGAAMLIWLAARKHQPGLQLQEVRALITDENLFQVLADYGEVIQVPGLKEEDGDDPKAGGPGGSPGS